MSAGRLANLALVLAVAGWLAAFCGTTAVLGDPAPTIPRSVIEAQRHLSTSVMLLGVLGILSSLWLSGRSFPEAKKRSILVIALIAVPAAAVAVSLY
ncbi:hypothetical protein [Dyella flagellata]|uniref:TrbC/VIRB2 family protein n=1 Tax=Dyella flagellata TaxID=1867833 RepID=A0ABQ5X9E8_9GAMM|nr:hypothetical protein [Dyella flagellata]GLQ88300.1 hypothetical protein GCM10007898_18690 [Dyella flagellata]